MNSLKEKVNNKKPEILIWGLGYIGISTAIAFAEEGFYVKCVDINKKIVEKINEGILPIDLKTNSKQFKKLVEQKLIVAVYSAEKILDSIDIHIVCVNTEKKGEPTSEPIDSVITNISERIREEDTLVLVESTIPPTWIDKYITNKLTESYFVGVAPRRDWFLEEGMNLKTLPRVVGMNRNKYKDTIVNLYSNLSEKVIEVADGYHASLVKSVENSLRYLNIVFTNEIMQAYPDYNISEVFSAASTKWNIPKYHPSIGIGGYCLPLAPQYLTEGSKHPEELSMLTNAMKSASRTSKFVTNFINQFNIKKICILGLSYAADIKIEKSSPVITLSEELSKNHYEVYLHDPFYTSDEIESLTNAKYKNYKAESLKDIELFIVASSHQLYKETFSDLLNKINKEIIVIDNLGKMKDLNNLKSIKYIEMGNFNQL